MKVSNIQLCQAKLDILFHHIFPYFPTSDSKHPPCRKCFFVSWQSHKIHRFNIRSIFSVSFSVNWTYIYETKFEIIAWLEYRFHIGLVTITFHKRTSKTVKYGFIFIFNDTWKAWSYWLSIITHKVVLDSKYLLTCFDNYDGS